MDASPVRSDGSLEAQIVEIRKFCTHDGPGIRTTVFLKGCPLRCAWCSNPETWSPRLEVFFQAKLCRRCGACLTACPEKALDGSPPRVQRKRCNGCGVCAQICPHRAFRQVSRAMTVEQVLAEVIKDKIFYGMDGGLTLGGGEPLARPDFVFVLMEECRARGVGTVIDTSAHCPADVAIQATRKADLLLVDIKHMDAKRHKAFTGVSNTRILRNAARMAARGKVRISLPLVPGFNDDKKNLLATLAFARDIGALALDIAPLHHLGKNKYRALDRPDPYRAFRTPSGEKLFAVQRMAQDADFPVTLGRMM